MHQVLVFLKNNAATSAYRVQAIIVASPTETHEGIVLSALENNKAVLCEKPITEDAEKVKRCLEKASAVNRPLLAAFNR